ncbi:hypothetical protein PMAYCL1PPCAC_00527, partial [Pristionchus mayeri]
TPFNLPSDVIPPEKKRAQTEKRLHSIEEEIRSLRVKCDEVLRVKERIEKIEEKIKSLSSMEAIVDKELAINEDEEELKKSLHFPAHPSKTEENEPVSVAASDMSENKKRKKNKKKKRRRLLHLWVVQWSREVILRWLSSDKGF